MAARKVLIVDDEPGVLAVASRLLRGAGYAVETADSAEAGLALVRTGEFDAVLMDISMPGMTGFRALEEFGACTKAPIFLMTGHSDAEKEKDALLLWARALLPKPLDFELLKGLLEALPNRLP